MQGEIVLFVYLLFGYAIERMEGELIQKPNDADDEERSRSAKKIRPRKKRFYPRKERFFVFGKLFLRLLYADRYGACRFVHFQPLADY